MSFVFPALLLELSRSQPAIFPPSCGFVVRRTRVLSPILPPKGAQGIFPESSRAHALCPASHAGLHCIGGLSFMRRQEFVVSRGGQLPASVSWEKKRHKFFCPLRNFPQLATTFFLRVRKRCRKGMSRKSIRRNLHSRLVLSERIPILQRPNY